MKHRNLAPVLLLPFLTFGIYSLYWQVKTKGEMNSLGAQIPTAWLLIIPVANIWWFWKYCEGVEHVTAGKLQGIVAFLVLWLLGPIGQAIVQDSFNKITAPATAQPVASTPVASVAPAAVSPISPATTSPPVPPVTPPTNPVS